MKREDSSTTVNRVSEDILWNIVPIVPNVPTHCPPKDPARLDPITARKCFGLGCFEMQNSFLFRVFSISQ